MKTTAGHIKVVFASFAALFILGECFAQPPVAGFSASATTGCFPLIVTFSDTSANNPSSWLWDFGNGNTSAFQNPSATYSTAGTYTVKLIACNSYGCDTLIKYNYITAVDKPIANFISFDSAGCAPLGIQFADSSIPVSSPIVSWYWDFGDGNFSAVQNPFYTYSFPGIYNVSLSITDSLGCNRSMAVDSFIIVSTPPDISFSADTSFSCTAPLNVTFTNNTTAGTYPLASWLWDFGDNISDTAMNTQHQYDSLGTYTVTLTAADSIGCVATLTDTDAISIGKDSADFTFTTLRTCEELQVTFSASANDSISGWSWDFGDDAPPETGQYVTHSYTSSGIFNVSLIATNLTGCPGTVSKTLSFLKVKSGFAPDTTYACSTPFTVSFTDTSTGTPPLSYQWDFNYDTQQGFSIQSTAQNPANSYSSEGIYDVMLVVTDSFGCTDTASLWALNDSIIISKPNAGFSAFFYDGCAPLNDTFFTDTSTAAPFPIVAWQWNFGDTASGASNFSTQPSPAHTFNDVLGIFTVQLTVTNSLGCTETASEIVQTGYPSVADSLVKSADTACHGALVFFEAFYSDPNINGGYWVWGDGGSNIGGLSGYHGFDALGDIVVQFYPMVNGCMGAPLYSTIFILPPKPLFTATPNFSCSAPLTVTFTNNSLFADNAWWNFKDGSPLSNAANPVHTYTTPGNYYATLTVSNNSTGCEDSTWQEIRIPQPTANFIATKLSGCAPLTVNFSNASITSLPFQYPIASYFWDFGDNTTSTLQNPVHTYTDTSSFTVTLVITDAAGCKDTLIKPGYISTSGTVASFSTSASVGCPPFQASFTDQSNPYLPIVSWKWIFGDGSPPDSTQNPTHIYATPGNYSPSLTVTDSIGCSNTFSVPTAITVSKPDAQFSAPGKTCLFTSTFFVNNTPGIASSYLWDFGDGSTSVNANPVHVYSDTGFHTVTLIVADTNNCTDTATSQIEGIAPPVANFTLDTFLALCPPLLIHFTDFSTSINDSIVSWKWNFGDNGIATVPSPIHTYTYADTFSVKLTVTNSTGCANSLFIPDMIKISGPYGNFNFSPDTGCVPVPVVFSASTGNTEQFIWDFGDGVLDTSLIPTATHSYIQAGFQIPQLSIVDSVGCKVAALPSGDSLLFVDEVVSGFSFAPVALYTPFCPPDTVFFTNASLALNDSSLITQWSWNFGDGSTDTVENPFHIYSDTGEYAISLVSYSSMGCSDTITKTINVMLNDSLVLKAAIQNSKDVTCFELNDGEAAAIGLSGTMPYTYLWSNGDTLSAIDSLQSANFTVTVTDANGCTAIDSAVISEPSALNVSVSSTEVSCHGGNDGSSTVAASGGTPPYSYLWIDLSDTIATTSSAFNLPAQIYYVTVTDSNGCTFSLNDTIREPDSLLIFIMDTIPVACYGDSTGSATVGASGGTSPYSYNWIPSFAGTNDTAINLPAQNYTAVVTDNNGCDTLLDLTISQPTQLNTATATENVTCYNGSNGSVTANASGGTSLYTYLWSSGDSSATVANLSAGFYYVTVKDANDCIAYDSIQVFQPDSIIIVFNTDSISCFGGNNGSAVAVPSGGTPPYAYLWSTGDTNSFIFNLIFSVFNITVTDSAGCIASDSVQTSEPDSMVLVFSTDSVSCFEGNDGLATVMANGGTLPYTFLWDDINAQVTPTVTGLSSGTWSVTVTDTNNCFITDTVMIAEPLPLTLDISTTAVLCYGDSSGTAAVTVEGGSLPYSYLWNTGGNQSAAGNLLSATYSVTVTDANNCEADTQATVSEPPKLLAFTTKKDVTCYNGGDGSASVVPGGGILPYAYLWSDFQSDSTATGLSAGTYFVTVTDSNGCIVQDSVIVAQALEITFSFTTGYTTCYGKSDGSATLNPSGGTPLYTYLWNDSSSQATTTATGLYSAVWTVTVTDSVGCIASDSVLVPQPDSITVLFNTDSVSCFGGNDGSAMLTANGGTPPYDYLWSDSASQTGQTLTGVLAGTYTVSVTDSNNCSVTDTAMIAEPLLLKPDINATNVLCYGDSNGTATVTVTGGTYPYFYQWNDPGGQTTSTANGLLPGTLLVIVTDTNNCVADTQAFVSEPPLLNATILEVRSVLCNGKNNGELTAQPSGGVQPYYYLWEPINADTSSVANLSPGQYILLVTDSNGCIGSDTVDISELSPLTIAISASDSDTACYNIAYQIDAQPSGSAPPYFFFWTNGNDILTDNPIDLLLPGSETWSLTVTDSAGCTASGSEFLFINQLEVNMNAPDTACLYSETTFEAMVSGALPDSIYYYQWNTGDTTSIITVPLSNISYQVMVSDGCSKPATDSATVYTYPVPSIKMKIKSQPVCPFTEIIFSEIENNPEYAHFWDFGDNTFAYGTSVQHAYSAGGEYYPSVTLTSLVGCNYSLSASQPVIIYAVPKADFEAEPFEASILSPVIEFTNLSFIAPVVQDEISSYSWSFGDGGFSDIQHVSHTYNDTGSYPVTLTVTTQYGCENQITKEIIIHPYIDLLIPTAFTPNINGSSGGYYDSQSFDNDVFYPITNYVTDYLLQVFNRWGELIFESTNYAVGWDGYYRGKLAQQDTYIWKIKIGWVTGEKFNKEGRVLLIR